MDVSSVSSSYSATTQAQNTQARPAERPEPTQQKPRPQEAEAARSEERKPPPVVNTQGQTTGRIVNTSA